MTLFSKGKSLKPGEALTIFPEFFSKKRGRVLVSYIKEASYKNPANYYLGHSNKWESSEIVKTFVSLGYITDVIDWDDKDFVIKEKYDIILDIYTRFNDWRDVIPSSTTKLLHLTGSYPRYQNKAELTQAQEFKKRTGINYALKRQVLDLEGACSSIRSADYCSLLGNEHTIKTYPKTIQSKITAFPVTASTLGYRKTRNYLPNRSHYLWYFGRGAVHKGLDKVIEVFLGKPDIHLHIIGSVDNDDEFWNAYKTKISDSHNIHLHGYLMPNSINFTELIKNIYCFIAPSCSESMSTSVATCLQLGLYPIISRDTGITLSRNNGIYLDDVGVISIKKALATISRYTDDRIIRETKAIQQQARTTYSREYFSKNFREYINQILIHTRSR